LAERVEAVVDQVKGLDRPMVFVMEWTNPIFNAGHWTPELVRLAGGTPLLAAEGGVGGLGRARQCLVHLRLAREDAKPPQAPVVANAVTRDLIEPPRKVRPVEVRQPPVHDHENLLHEIVAFGGGKDPVEVFFRLPDVFADHSREVNLVEIETQLADLAGRRAQAEAALGELTRAAAERKGEVSVVEAAVDKLRQERAAVAANAALESDARTRDLCAARIDRSNARRCCFRGSCATI